MRIWPVDVLHAAFFSGQIVILGLTFGTLPDWGAWLAFDLAALGGLALIVATSDGARPRREALLRLAHGCVVIPLVFTQVGLTIRALGRPDRARALEELDRALCGGTNPLEALEPLASPPLTEAMQWAYTAYVLLPPAAVLVLALKASPQTIARSLFSMLAVLYLSYVGYYLIPAMGPNIHNNFGPLAPVPDPVMPLYTFRSDLPGTWMTAALREWMFSVELTKKDCFPSGHTAMAIACVFYGFRSGRAFGWAFVPVAVGVVLSTVYLRYHYVVDVLAGVVLALLCVGPLERLHRRFDRLIS
jgi:membrane-associated phospholipid phosphatase